VEVSVFKESATMTTTVREILDAKRLAGEAAYLWLTLTGTCSLYGSETDSDDPSLTLQKWELGPSECDQLTKAGIVDGTGVCGAEEKFYESIRVICFEEFQVSSTTDPDLFDRITAQLAAAGVSIDPTLTKKARAESPNVVAVFNEGAELKSYVEIEDRDAFIYPYDGGILVELVTVRDFEDTGLTQDDLSCLRYLERDGERFYDESDINILFSRKRLSDAGRRIEED